MFVCRALRGEPRQIYTVRTSVDVRNAFGAVDRGLGVPFVTSSGRRGVARPSIPFCPVCGLVFHRDAPLNRLRSQSALTVRFVWSVPEEFECLGVGFSLRVPKTTASWL